MSTDYGFSYCRVERLTGDPKRVDEATKLWAQDILPILKEQEGFSGLALVGNRETGDAMSISYWASEAAMKSARKVRSQVLRVLDKIGGSIVEDDECEVAVLERIKPPKSGVWDRAATVNGDPAHVDEAIANFKEKIVPTIKMQSGARTALLFVNRHTGKMFAGSVWDTEQGLLQSEADNGGLLAEAIKRFAGRDALTEVFQIYSIEILAPAALVD